MSHTFTALKQWHLSDSWHQILESLLVLISEKEVFLTRLNQKSSCSSPHTTIST